MIRLIRNLRYLYTLLLLSLSGCVCMLRAQVAGRHLIQLKSGTIYAKGNAAAWLDSTAVVQTAEPMQVLIHFNGLPTKAQKALLSQSGVTLLDYIPENTYSALVKFPLDRERLAALPIHSIVDMKPEMKADGYLWRKIDGQKGGVEVLVSFYPGIDDNTIRDYVSRIGGRVEKGLLESYGSYKVAIASNRVRTLAQWYGVRYISPVVSKMAPLDLQSMPAVKANIAASSLYGGYGLNGDGVTVGVGDDASGAYHIDLVERTTNFCPGPPSLHGQLVNGYVGAAAIIDPLATTMTPHVTLVDHYFDNILPSTGALYNDYNMTIANNSYSLIADNCDYSGTYDGYSQFLDTLAIQYPNVQHVFASGNDGLLDCPPYVLGFATVAGGYQPAKNIITVGSMTDFLSEAVDESRGPTKDGRLKPEIVAIGLGSYSTAPFNIYKWDAGTSIAAPQVAGGLAALTQRFKQLNAGAQPRADVLKAIILDGAMDLGNPGPDYSYGYGAMDMYRSLQIMDNNHFIIDSVNNGDSQSYTITVPPNTAQLKVLLYWNDVPGNPSSAKDLVNDLDLTVADPSSAVHLPLILDPTPANVNNVATVGSDHLNNSEQVTINNPVAGGYKITSKGYSVPSGKQRFVIAYDMIPPTLHLTFPLGGEQLPNVAGDTLRVFWDVVASNNTFTCQFSQDNGGAWTTISNSVPATNRSCDFLPSGINSGNCLIRVINNGTSETVTSQRFAITDQTVVGLDTTQCPGYVNIHWSPVLNASGYYLWKKVGLYIQVVDSVSGVNDTTYSFGGMSMNSNSYVAVQPIINGIPGYRSLAITALANTGNCTNPVSNGDLALQNIVSPGNGRMYTSTQLTSGSGVKVNIRNLYQANCTHYKLSYKVNSGAWQQLVNPGILPANSAIVVTIPAVSFTVTGTYNVVVALTNTDLTDPQPLNDTIAFTVVNIPNDTLNLNTPFFDGFETMGKFSVHHDSIGVSPNGHWDYFNINDSGRMRSFVDDDITISGSRSVSLDENYSVRNGSRNMFVGTFNLLNYDTATAEVRADFDYILHGTPKADSGNVVLMRGNDTSAWIPVFSYDFSAYPGYATPVHSMSLTDALRQGRKNFSTSTQVSFGQNDTSLIALINYGNGVTIDNFRLYTVTNDAQMASVVSPLPTNCGLPSSVPLEVQVRNGVQKTLYNIKLFYSLDGGTTYSDTIDSLGPKKTVNFTFTQPLSLPSGTTHSLTVWLTETGDSYTANDTIANYNIRNSMIFNSFPYLENFEAGNGGYFSNGFLNSWEYGTPASPKIHNAASGTKAWKTNLTGHYNNLEKSYLYSPCFDISQMLHPMLSFSSALDIENCGNTLCDAAWIEYSFDGIHWTKLGASGQGTNWYDPTFDIWNPEGFTRWHVASIPFPGLGGGTATRLRFVLAADPGVTFEGFAVDDVHIYDLANPILPVSGVTSVSNNVSGSSWTDYTWSNQALASIDPNNQTIANTEVTLYEHDTVSNADATQYIFPRSYTISSPVSPADSVGIRLYLTDSEFVSVLNDTTCPSCARVTDAYRLGITQYDNYNNKNAENGTLSDDTGGVFSYYPYGQVTWVPYDKGYYAQINAKPFSEFWFNNGGPTGAFAAGVDYLSFVAYKNGSDVTTYWYSLIDTSVNTYAVQRSIDSVNFADVLDTASTHSNPGNYTYNDFVGMLSSNIIYYRLRWTMTGQDSAMYSPIRRVDLADTSTGPVTFSAHMIDDKDVFIDWSSSVDRVTNYYLLERAIGSGAYKSIANVPAIHFADHFYYFTDQPGPLSSGTKVHYRLTPVLEDNSQLHPPIQTVEWMNANSVVSLYPNPTYDGVFTIAWNANPGTVMNVNITNMLGQNMYRTNVTSAQWNNITTLQTFHRPQGVYDVLIDIGGSKTKMKVVYQ